MPSRASPPRGCPSTPTTTRRVLDAYLAFAFRHAGLAVEDLPTDGPGRGQGHHGRTARTLRALEARDSPFVLALDDLERLSDPRSVALVEFLIRRAPPNLRLAVALHAARTRAIDDPASTAIAHVLLRELDLERHRRPPPPESPAVPAALTSNGTPFLSYAAAAGIAAGQALCSGDGSAPAVLRRPSPVGAPCPGMFPPRSAGVPPLARETLTCRSRALDGPAYLRRSP